MKALDALNIINDVSASQRGLFTAAQATALGIDRMALSRLAAHDQIVPVMRGVFRAAAAPAIREEDVYAVWLATSPKTPAYLRALDGSDCVASLGTAAWLLGLGELKPEPITFSYPKRKQSRNASLRFIKRSLCDKDVCVAAGIPTTTPKRTILDLLDYGEDLSLVASVLRDAELNARSSVLRDAELNVGHAALRDAELDVGHAALRDGEHVALQSGELEGEHIVSCNAELATKFNAEPADCAISIKDDVNLRATTCGFDKDFDLYTYLKES